MSEPFELVTDHGGVHQASVDPLEGQVGGDKKPFTKELQGLGLTQSVDEGRGSRPGAKEGVMLEGHNRSRIQTECASVFGEVCQ